MRFIPLSRVDHNLWTHGTFLGRYNLSLIISVMIQNNNQNFQTMSSAHITTGYINKFASLTDHRAEVLLSRIFSKATQLFSFSIQNKFTAIE